MKNKFVILVIAMAFAIAGCGGATDSEAVAGGSETDDGEIAFGESSDGGDADDDKSVDGPDDNTTDDDLTAADPTAEDAGQSGTVAGTQDETTGDESTADDDEQPAPVEGEAQLGTLRQVLLTNTLDTEAGPSSARFEGTMTMIGAPGSGLEGELSIVFSGGYDLATNASEVNMDLSGVMAAAAAGASEEEAAGIEMFSGLFEEPMQVIVVDDRSWMKWGLISLLTGSGDKWIEGEADQTSDMTTGFGFGGNGSPTDMLDLLADGDAEVTKVGQEEIRGVTTTHYRAMVDTATLAAGLPPEEQAELAAQLGSTDVVEVPLEVWIDDDGLLHRYVLDLSDAVLAQQGETEFTGATFVFDMWDHGQDLGIAPPPADEVLTAEELNFDLGDLGSLGG